MYGRIGTHTVEFGTLASWAVDVLNAITGNLDRPGGAMFPLPAHERTGPRRPGRGFSIGRHHSRVKGYPEVRSELPVATLADEIETPGEGQIRAMVKCLLPRASFDSADAADALAIAITHAHSRTRARLEAAAALSMRAAP